MKQIPAQLLADLQSDLTSLAFLWTIEMSDGRLIRGTEHDLDIILPDTGETPPDKYAGHYFAVANVTMGDIASTTDMSVDNLDVSGAFPDSGSTPRSQMYTPLDVTRDEIEDGLLNQAPVSVLICNWRAPEHGYWVAKAGTLGTINYDSDNKYTTEVRGLTQQLAQTIIRTFSATCNVVRFGDQRCKLTPKTATGTITTWPSRVQSAVTIDGAQSPPIDFTEGTLTFTSGDNNGFFREIKVDPQLNNGVVVFWEQFPEDAVAGDTFIIKEGCDRQFSTCKAKNNILNFRGFGLFIPGVNAIAAGPDTVSGLA